jgi:Bacteriocin class II with double-glycine leader peptide.
MENKFVTLTEEELTLVYGGKGGKSCVTNFLVGLAAGAAAGVPGGIVGIIGGANLGMVGGAISCL